MTRSIEFRAVSKRFGEHVAVERLSFALDAGATLALVGPSGCGKTTSLKMINRLIEPSEGEILVNGEAVSRMPVLELRRSLGYVIQQVGLFPHMSVAENVAVVPRLLGWPPGRIRARVDELLDLVGLPPAVFRDRRPRALSGGQQQRVGVARALAADPPILLMDEPFGALDPITRERLQEELASIQSKLRKTVVIVTHDMNEAVRLADRIAVLREGRLVQIGAPAELLHTPADAFVAELLGRDRRIRLLRTLTVAGAMSPPDPGVSEPSIGEEESLEAALIALLEHRAGALAVRSAAGAVVGALRPADLVRARPP